MTEKIGQKVIILLQGDVDASDNRLSRRFQSPQALTQHFHVWIDCTAVACLKNYGVCHFINQLLLLKKAGNVQVSLLYLKEHQRALLQLLQLDSLFSLVPDFEEAYQLVQDSN